MPPKLPGRIDPTTIGVAFFYAYPPLILLYDAVLKFILHAPTITARVSESMDSRIIACAYMALWCLGLTLHFGLGWLRGFPPDSSAEDGSEGPHE